MMGKKEKRGGGGHVGRGRNDWCSEEPQGRVMTLHRTDTVMAARYISAFCPAVSDQFHGKLISGLSLSASAGASGSIWPNAN